MECNTRARPRVCSNMDSAVEFEGFAAVGGKRKAENRNDGESEVRFAKKARGGGGLVGDMKKVAAIVLVLAAMGKMRAGRGPTAAEKGMMEAARGRLVEVCERFAPKDVFPREEFGGVIEDLGLNNLKQQRLGFQPPKISIAEKMSIATNNMEKLSQQLRMNSCATAESSGTSHTARMLSSEKQNYASNSSRPPQSAAKSTSLTYQLPASEVKASVVSMGLPSTHIGRESSLLPVHRVDRENFRLDGRSNGSYTLLVQANTSGDHTEVKTQSGSVQPQYAKVVANAFVTAEGTADLSSSQVASQVKTHTSHITQNASGNLPTMHHHLQGMNSVQAPSLYYSHNEIGRNVQKLLQSQILEQPTWTPPSRDYMNKAVTCQMCKVTINEVENLLVCDFCEKGFHLKCLQSRSKKGIPIGDWHCQNCLASRKPLALKFGRVTRNINAPKVFSNTPGGQSFPENKMGNSDVKIYQKNTTANENFGLQSATFGNVGNNYNYPVSGSKMPIAREMQGNISSSREKIDDKPCSGTCQNDVTKGLEAAFVSPAGSSLERPVEGKFVSEVKAEPPLTSSDTVTETLNQSQASHNIRYNDQAGLTDGAEIPLKQCHDNNVTVEDLESSSGRETLYRSSTCEIKQDEQGVVWIGNALQVMNGMTYFQSCFINGTVYKVHDHAIFRSTNDKLMPCKIQVMWEDSTTRSKWVTVNQCYFPGDLPEVVGCPCGPESTEVYESNHPCTIMADLIQGPCQVLPQEKFVEEIERRTPLKTGVNDGLQPLFICKWFYDESKGLFRDISN